jgi:NADPH:quinone reductase-like Zn-dependent oxidoreductase
MTAAFETEALWVLEPGRAAICPQRVRQPGAAEVRVRTRYTAVSRGSEALVHGGHVPVNQYEAMRAPFQEGDFPGPVKYGYISVGDVVAGPDGWVGTTVFCLYPHQREYVVPATAVVPLPGDVPAERAVLAANMETAVNALWDGGPLVGERIAVIGAGLVGCLVARLATAIPGTAVTLVDPQTSRQSVARELGVAFATPDELAGEFDRIFHASASEAGLRQALSVAAFEAVIVELSWFGDRAIALPLGEAFHSRRLTLRSSQVGGVPAGQRPRWDHGRRLALAVALLNDPALDSLITGESDFPALPQVLAELSRGPGATLCHRIRYSD